MSGKRLPLLFIALESDLKKNDTPVVWYNYVCQLFYIPLLQVLCCIGPFVCPFAPSPKIFHLHTIVIQDNWTRPVQLREWFFFWLDSTKGMAKVRLVGISLLVSFSYFFLFYWFGLRDESVMRWRDTLRFLVSLIFVVKCTQW